MTAESALLSRSPANLFKPICLIRSAFPLENLPKTGVNVLILYEVVTPCVPTETLILVTDAPPPAGIAGAAQLTSPYDAGPRGHCFTPTFKDLAPNKRDAVEERGDPTERLG